MARLARGSQGCLVSMLQRIQAAVAKRAIRSALAAHIEALDELGSEPQPHADIVVLRYDSSAPHVSGRLAVRGSGRPNGAEDNHCEGRGRPPQWSQGGTASQGLCVGCDLASAEPLRVRRPLAACARCPARSSLDDPRDGHVPPDQRAGETAEQTGRRDPEHNGSPFETTLIMGPVPPPSVVLPRSSRSCFPVNTSHPPVRLIVGKKRPTTVHKVEPDLSD